MIAAIIKNPVVECNRWEIACNSLGVDYITIDTSRNDYLELLNESNPDFCLSRPSGITQYLKKIYDERIFAIERFLNIPVFPSYNEIILHENKIMLSYFLKSYNLPHPETFVSFNKDECLAYAETTSYPIVAKTANGAAGSGVTIIKSKVDAQNYIKKAFNSGIKRRYGPNRKTGNARSWLLKAWRSPEYLKKKFFQYKLESSDSQKDYIIFQSFIPHDFEWRCVKIGESYFAYKKLKIGEKASGSKIFDYGAPPFELLSFTKDICQKFNFEFMAVDIFYTNGHIYINEMQTLFGHKSAFICKVNEKTGRFIFNNNVWQFEEGNFNSNESFNIRLAYILDKFKNDKK